LRRGRYLRGGRLRIRIDARLGVPDRLRRHRNSHALDGEIRMKTSEIDGLTRLTETQAKITNEIYKAVDALGGAPCLLSAIGSWGDTLSDQTVLDILTDFNAGKAMFETEH
jgi:hypothetical protein